MPLRESGIPDIQRWSLEAKWSVSTSSADAVRSVENISIDAKFIVGGISAQVEADSKLRTLNREYEKLLETAADLEVPRLLLELEQKRAAIANELATRKAALLEAKETTSVTVEPKARVRLYSRLVDPDGGTACDTSSSRPPKVYYVIVGRGTAAVLNHATLRQTAAGDTRLQHNGVMLPVLHIGLADPWFYYHAHGMGQPPFLLSLPGMHFKPTGLDRLIRSGLHSNDFAFKTLQEWSLLKVKYGFEHLEGWVATVQRQGDAWAPPAEWAENTTVRDAINTEWNKPWTTLAPAPHFRVIVVLADGSATSVYAEKIDFCTGIPRPAIENGQPHRDAIGRDCAEALTRLWEPPEQWTDAVRHRRIVTGPEALCEMTSWFPHERHCVHGGGGIGLNMIERAEDVGNASDWMHYQTLHNSFNLARNDTVLKDPITGVAMVPGASNLRHPVTGAVQVPGLGNPAYNTIPASPRWRFARFAPINSIQAAALVRQGVGVPPWQGRKVRVHVGALPAPLAPPANAPVILDHSDTTVSAGTAIAGAAFPLSPAYQAANPDINVADGIAGDYDRVWITAANIPEALGSPICILDTRFPLAAVNNGAGHTVALSADNGLIRLLGAAANQHTQWGVLRSGTTLGYFNSLPLSAVPPGFIYAAVNIADANGWFAAHPNENANTMTGAAIEQYLLGKNVGATLARDLGVAVVAARRPHNGFATASAVEAVMPGTITAQVGWQAAVRLLKFDYADAGALRPG